jgi:hypothetical protein
VYIDNNYYCDYLYTDLAAYSYLDLQTGIGLGRLRWLEDAEEIRTDECDRLDALVDRVI